MAKVINARPQPRPRQPESMQTLPIDGSSKRRPGGRILAVAMTGTHDLPTLVGWRRGLDIGWRHRLGELDEEGLRQQATERSADIARLDEAMKGRALDEISGRRAALEYVGASPSALALLPVEDALGMAEQVNLPGTLGTHPNWRQRLPVEGDEHTLEDAMERFAAARAQVRP